MKVNCYYPYKEGCKFDAEYYATKHMPMVKEILGDKCEGFEVKLGVCGMGTPDPKFVAVGVIDVTSPEDFGAAFMANAEKITEDIKNFTDIEDGFIDFAKAY